MHLATLYTSPITKVRISPARRNSCSGGWRRRDWRAGRMVKSAPPPPATAGPARRGILVACAASICVGKTQAQACTPTMHVAGGLGHPPNPKQRWWWSQEKWASPRHVARAPHRTSGRTAGKEASSLRVRDAQPHRRLIAVCAVLCGAKQRLHHFLVAALCCQNQRGVAVTTCRINGGAGAQQCLHPRLVSVLHCQNQRGAAGTICQVNIGAGPATPVPLPSGRTSLP